MLVIELLADGRIELLAGGRIELLADGRIELLVDGRIQKPIFNRSPSAIADSICLHTYGSVILNLSSTSIGPGLAVSKCR